MDQLTASITYTFVTLLAMVNPLEAAGAFASLTSDRPAAERMQIALKASVAGAVILLAFGFVGDALLSALGISIQAFKIAGGLLLLRVGFNMVFAEQTDADTADSEKKRQAPRDDPSIFPLAIPILSGPGALTAAVTIFGRSHEHQWLAYAIITVITIVVFVITYAAMVGSTQLSRILGKSGIEALSRIVGIIVAAIAVQLVIDGAGEITRAVIH